MAKRFTVHLPVHKAEVVFPYGSFTKLFKDSVITLALQSGEDIIPLDHPLATPDILQILSAIIETGGDYQYTLPEHKKAFDYLSIDLPEMVYDPKYLQFRDKYKVYDFKLTRLDQLYRVVLQESFTLQFPDLAKYVIDHTDGTEHYGHDIGLISSHLRPGSYSETEESILIHLITSRDLYTDLSKDILHVIAGRGYIRLFEAVNKYFVDYDLVIMEALASINNDPEHYDKYLQMITYLDKHHHEHLSGGDISMLISIQVIMQGLSSPSMLSSNYIPSLLYLSVLKGNPEQFDTAYSIGNNSFGGPFIDANRKFRESYFSHPSLITLDGLLMVLKNMSSEQRIQARTLLFRAGAHELIRLV